MHPEQTNQKSCILGGVGGRGGAGEGSMDGGIPRDLKKFISSKTYKARPEGTQAGY